MKRAVTFSECFTFILHIALLLARNEQFSYTYTNTHTSASVYLPLVLHVCARIYGVCMWDKDGIETKQSSDSRAEYAHQLIIVTLLPPLFFYESESTQQMCVFVCACERMRKRDGTLEIEFLLVVELQ